MRRSYQPERQIDLPVPPNTFEKLQHLQDQWLRMELSDDLFSQQFHETISPYLPKGHDPRVGVNVSCQRTERIFMHDVHRKATH